jgi:hypothetical protein
MILNAMQSSNNNTSNNSNNILTERTYPSENHDNSQAAAIAFNVYDGTGERIKQQNHRFRSLIRSMHQYYKYAATMGVKKQMAEDIYSHIRSNGGDFYNVDGTTKSFVDALQKIQKSLKDMRCTTTTKTTSTQQHQLNSHYLAATAQVSTRSCSSGDGSSTIATDVSPFANDTAEAFHVWDGMGGRIKNMNVNFRIIIRSAHEQYKLASSSDERRQLAETVYRYIRGKGGQFYNINKTEKSMEMAIQKVRKALRDMQYMNSEIVSDDMLSHIWKEIFVMHNFGLNNATELNVKNGPHGSHDGEAAGSSTSSSCSSSCSSSIDDILDDCTNDDDYSFLDVELLPWSDEPQQFDYC